MHNFSRFIIISSFFLTLFFGCQSEPIVVDILIQNGTIYNGVDTNSQKVSIGILADKIVFIGNEKGKLIEAKKTIDAAGLIVCPGFIDPHTHSDRELKIPEKSHNLPFLMQGVTTVVAGNDGNSFFPTKDFKALYEKHGIGTNAVLLTGHGTIRKLVVGRTNRKATEEEMKNMESLVQKEMDAGAFGLTTGLFYAPGSYGDTDEIIALAKVVAKNNGIYDSHIRDEGSYSIGLKGAIEEAIEIGRQAKLPIHIAHIKCLGVDVWNQSKDIIELIEEARKEGIDVTADQYPYDASATGLQAATVPRWAESGGKDSLFLRYNQAQLRDKILKETKENITRRGGPDKLLFVQTDDSMYVGKNLKEVAQILQLPAEAAVYTVLKDRGVRVASFNMTQNDIYNFMKQPWVVTGSDGNSGHPRKYGSFPRKYHKYVQQEKVISLPVFINGSTSKTAEILKIPNRGKLQEGYIADVIIFNPKTFKDIADYTNAFENATGLEFSIINGKLSVEDGKFTDQLNGRVLTK
jgi:N-acyl-D-amino-acid deacylase